MMKNNLTSMFLASVMVFITMGFIFTPYLPFSDNSIIYKGIEYTVHTMLGLFALSILFYLLGKFKLMFIGMACVSILCIFLKDASNMHLLLPSNEISPKIKIAHYNLSYIDEEDLCFLESLSEQNIDIISLQELTPDWAVEIDKQLLKSYPYTSKNVRIDPFGMAIYSRTKLFEDDTIFSDSFPSIHTSIELGGKMINVLCSYILPPLNESASELAKSQLGLISNKINSLSSATIVLGDFNMVYWSNHIRSFRTESKLSNSRRGFTPLDFDISYDHIFYTDELECSHFEEILNSSSNHIGIQGTFQFKNLFTEKNDILIGSTQ